MSDGKITSYSRVTNYFWSGTTGRLMRRESPWVRIVAMYLVTCPTKSMTGLYYLPIPTLVHEIGCTRAEAIHALRRLRALGFAYYDPAHELVYVVNMAREQVAESLHEDDKRVVGVQRIVRPYLHTRLGRAWVARYGRAFRCTALLQELQRVARARGRGRGAAELELDQVEAVAGEDLDELEPLDLKADDLAPGLDELAEDLSLAGPGRGAELELDQVEDSARARGRARVVTAEETAAAATRAMQLLSHVTGRRFRVTQPVRDDVAVLLAASFTIADIESVIQVKARHWRHDAKMAQNLTPRALLARDKFERYLEEDVRAGPVLTPEEAFKIVVKEMQRCGGRYGRPTLEPLLMAAVNRVGWANLCLANSHDAPRMFAAAYKAVTIDTPSADGAAA